MPANVAAFLLKLFNPGPATAPSAIAGHVTPTQEGRQRASQDVQLGCCLESHGWRLGMQMVLARHGGVLEPGRSREGRRSTNHSSLRSSHHVLACFPDQFPGVHCRSAFPAGAQRSMQRFSASTQGLHGRNRSHAVGHCSCHVLPSQTGNACTTRHAAYSIDLLTGNAWEQV